ncbi:MAG TPA: ribosome biogenesis factor YjgA [Chiayiivirga sp.]|nr:ribosome biogenesis factor YjgA [Chiayiivirga sp.]
MRGRDPETGEFLSPSRSQKRREALDVLALAERLVELPDGQLAAIALPDDLRELVRDSRRITAQIARKRQLQFLAKAMRREEEDVLDAIRGALDKDRDQSRRETAELHRLEDWRERLLEDGDEALAELLDQYPAADRQLVRQLVRNARLEREKQRPPRAFRELFRVLKTLMAGEGEIVDAPENEASDFDDQDLEP